MSLYITIDGGTTNTRVSLVENRKIIDSIKLSVGARASMDNNDLLRTEIKNALQKILQDNGKSENNVRCILASGMITSEFGLCNLEHIKAPAGINELHDSMFETTLKEITDIQFVFIRGVRVFSDSFENADMMRGEETELMGLINPEYGKCIYVLPGSHSKIIKTDDDGRICDFSTMLTGEMIASLSGHTILKDAVDLSTTEIDTEYLLKGYDYCESDGINKALFKARVLKNIFGCTKEEIYGFFIGVILCGEIRQIIKADAETVVVGGKTQIKNAMVCILKNRDNKRIVSLSEEKVSLSTALGAIRVYENTRK